MGLTSSATVPNGSGTQNFEVGNLSFGDPWYIKGEYSHVIFMDGGPQYMKAGSWITLTVGVFSSVDTLDNVAEELTGLKEFMDATDWEIWFDGVDLTEAFLDSGLYDNYAVYDWLDEDGNQWYDIVVRYNYYLVPQAIGCYPFYGSAEDGDFLAERVADLCWMPASFFKLVRIK